MLDSKLGKVILAVLGVVLMLAFLLPSTSNLQSGRGTTFGEADGRPLTSEDRTRARNLLGVANRIVVVMNLDGVPQQAALPVAALAQPRLDALQLSGLPPQQRQQAVAFILDSAVAQVRELEQSPVTLELLLRESARNGTAVSVERAAELLEQANAQVQIDESREFTAYRDIAGEALRQNYAIAAKSMFDVAQSMAKYGEFVKVSRPFADYQLAIARQQVEMDVVPFLAETYVDGVEEPSSSEISAQFDQFKDVAEGTVDDDNPFGFGYRLPRRVEFESIGVRAEDVERVVRTRLMEQPLAQRELALFRYWGNNPTRFPAREEEAATTQPATNPATQPAEEPAATEDIATTQPATQPSTQPADDADFLLASDGSEVKVYLDEQTAKLGDKVGADDWKAFVAVHDDVARAYLQAEVLTLENTVAGRINERLSGDFRRFDATRRRGEEAPETSAGVAYNADDYFEKLADHIAEQEGVRPTVRNLRESPMPLTDLLDPEKAGPIANAIVRDEDGNFQRFAQLLATRLVPLLNEEQLEAVTSVSRELELLEPTPVMIEGQNAWFARVTEALPDAPPESIDVVRDEIVRDLKLAEAYAQANEAAQALVSQAAEADGLAGPAPDRVVSVGPFLLARGPFDAESIGGPLSPSGLTTLAQATYSALPTGTRERGAIFRAELPADKRVLAAQVKGTEGAWTSLSQRDQILALTRRQASAAVLLNTQAIDEFFDPTNVATRVGFEPEKGIGVDGEPLDDEDGAADEKADA